MANKRATKAEILQWIPRAVEIFKRYMPEIAVPYPTPYLVVARNYLSTRARLIAELGAYHTEPSEEVIMEVLYGENGSAVLIRQDHLNNDEERFDLYFWHELGHFYAISSEKTNFRHYSRPGLVDDSKLFETDGNDVVMGLSDERCKQEGYWFWQEFIAESISKYVSYKYRSNECSYHPEDIDWHPKYWIGIVNRLRELLDNMLWYYPSTIDEYSLAHYYANLLMDDFFKLYVKAANDGLLKVYNEYYDVVTPKAKIEPTCIADIEYPDLRKPLWKIKDIVEEQLNKEHFWEIDDDFLLDVGMEIGNMMFSKALVLSEELH